MNEPLPLDVRLMNAVSTALMLACVFGVLVAGTVYLARHTAFSLRGIVITGDTTHNSAPTLRANVLPRLSGNFFTLDLQQTRRAFEQVPWVRTAVVKRDFPNRIQVKLQEHRAVALFGIDSESTMVNDLGEVFVANAADVTQDLPRLVGAESQAPQLLQMQLALTPIFAMLDLEIAQLSLSARGSWQAVLDNDAVLELGRGEDHLVLMQARRFAQHLTVASHQLGRTPQDLEFADLRYPSGFALRLRGISTQVHAGDAKK
jgi:cell division protein FtsQ